MRKGNLGSRIRELRQNAGMYLKDLADQMGWSVVYQSELERGRRNLPSKSKILRIAKILKADPSELLNLADRAKGIVQLDLSNKGPKKQEAALTLARSWDALTEADMEEIVSLINKRKSEDVED